MQLYNLHKKCNNLSIFKKAGLPRSLALPANGFANAYRLTILALLRMFALYRNDEKFLVPQCLSNLEPFCPLSLPSPSGGEGYRKAAFTLAEVLITLGIIGVVAAMTIPGLINNYKAVRLHSQFLKSYSTIQQAMKLMISDDVSTEVNNSTGLVEFANNFKKYLNGATDCTNKNLLPCYTAPNTQVGNKKPYKNLQGTGSTTFYSNVPYQFFNAGRQFSHAGYL